MRQALRAYVDAVRMTARTLPSRRRGYASRRAARRGYQSRRMVPMELVGVRLELPANTPIVLLAGAEGRRRVVPIYIGGPRPRPSPTPWKASSRRGPLTHDLLKNVLDELRRRLDRVVVTEIREQTYYAELHLVTGPAHHTVSSRPSDAIALAVRTGTPDLRRGEPARRGTAR